ncbi:hypothetical protein [Actinoplanes sp. HUAS TT8]|uniref:hypothetical protein n=1 Tax=Actinoplanes sp. HUAS TT8 TaxID=3447453 RepID=UPI003F5216E9
MTLVLAVAAGCGEKEYRYLPIGQATPGKPVKVAAKPDSSGLLPLDRWPNACGLMPEDAVRAVFPSATKVELKSASPTFSNSSVQGFGQKVSVKDATCQATVYFPESANKDDLGTRVSVVIRAAGTPEAAKSNFEENVLGSAVDAEKYKCPADLVSRFELDACSTHSLGSYTWAVLKNGIAAEVEADYPDYLENDVRIQGWTSNDTAEEVWAQSGIRNFVEVVASRLP